MAILDIEVLEVDPDKRDVILDDLIQEHGPSDCTVIVTMATGEEFSDEMIDAVLDTFAEADLSETILVRLVQVVDELWLYLNRVNDVKMGSSYDPVISTLYCKWSS